MPFRSVRLAGALSLFLFLITPSDPVDALERASRPAPDLDGDAWSAAGSCTVRYYNNCTGWVWVWSGWSPGEQIGTAFHRCCPSATLQLTNHLTFSGIGFGWGYTGTIGIYAADGNECPTGPPIAQQPWRPPLDSGWYADSWGVLVPQDFVVLITWGGTGGGFHDVTALASDHPAVGPTGPQACGTCYPSTRAVHSYHYGFRNAPLCPGTAFHDGTCDVEFMLDAVLACPVHTEESSWGKIKTFYR
jgi:hypothetical protein